MTPAAMFRSVTRGFIHAIVRGAAGLMGEPRYDREADLELDLAVLSRAAGVPALDGASLPPTIGGVPAYYTDTADQYSAVHSPAGSLHFGISRDGTFSHDHFYEQPRFIEALLARTGGRDVLELGSGKGFNLIYLAQHCPAGRFTGIDLTPLQVQLATERARGLGNLRFVEGDFHDLDQFPDGSLDIVFLVEAGCYSDTPEKLSRLFSGLRRVLRPGGRYVVWDYYRAPDFETRSRAQQRAVELVERAWVSQRFTPMEEWDAAAKAAGFSFESTEDLSKIVMPSLRRLYRGARLFYSVQPFLRWLPPPPTHNSVSVLMFPYALSLGAAVYRQAVLVRGAE